MDWDWSNWMLVFVRCSALLSVLPLFSSQGTPVVLRVALASMTSLLVAPLLPSPPPATNSLFGWIWLMGMEVSVGFLLGFGCRLLFYALELAGNIIGNEMGLMLSPNFNPLSSAPVAAPGLLLYWMGAMLLLSLDLHHWILVAFGKSYLFVPVGGAHLSEDLAVEVISRTGGMFSVALQIAAPLIAASFVISLIFALLSRAVPQMNVFSESFPVRTLTGLVVFGMTCPLMGQYMISYFQRLPEDIALLAKLLGGA